MEGSSFNCDLCSYKCKWINKLHKHIKQVHSVEKKLECSREDCTFTTKLSKELKFHLKTHNKIKQILCHYCNYECISKSAFKIHIKTHNRLEKNQQRDDFCDLKAAKSNQCIGVFKYTPMQTEGKLITNSELYNGSGQAQPDVDPHFLRGGINNGRNRGAKLQQQFNNHAIKHSNPKQLENLETFLCGQCGCKFVSKSGRKKHFITIHQSSSSAQDDFGSPKTGKRR